MSLSPVGAALAACLALGTAGPAQAQLFTNPAAGAPNRTIPSSSTGSSLGALGGMNRAAGALPGATGGTTGSPSGTPSGAPGTAQGDATSDSAFAIRRNHARGSFVGADSSDRMRFVGEQQAMGAGAIKSAISGLIAPKLLPNVNRPLPVRRKNDPYDVRMEVGFDYHAPPAAALSSTLVHRLQGCPSIHWTGSCAVSMEAGMATLRGEVASERDRALAEQLLLFEPGVAEVHNLLKVSGHPDPSPSAPRK